MAENQNKPYDLEERTFQFAKRTFGYLKSLTRTINNIEISKAQVSEQGYLLGEATELMKILGSIVEKSK